MLAAMGRNRDHAGGRPRRAGRLCAALACAILAAACSRETRLAETAAPQTRLERYVVRLEGVPPGTDIAAVAEEALQVYLLAAEGAPSRAFLRRRAQGDIPTLLRLMRSRGFYEAAAEVALSREGETPPAVIFRISPGPRYLLAEHRLEIAPTPDTPPPLDAAALGSPVGRPAEAAPIVQAEDAAVATLRRAGFAYARFVERDALADPQAKTITVTSRIEAGRRYRFGPVRYVGVGSVPESYLESYRTIRPGQPYDGAALAAFQRRLADTQLFASVTVAPPDSPPEGDELPITVTVTERPPRTVALGLRYDTSEGPQAYGRLEHRNTLGRNELASVEATAGLTLQEIAVTFRKPQLRRDGQALVAGLSFSRETGDAYDRLGGTATLGLERRLSARWTAGLGILAEASRVDDAGLDQAVRLAGLPGFLAWDSTDDALDPSRGFRLRLAATPFLGRVDGRSVAFALAEITGSTYVALDDDGRYILALRGRAGSILGASLADVPANHRLYAGGGGSVRGYGRDMIGPLDALNDPVGGLSAIEAGVELRARLRDDLGGALFLEAGSVSTDPWPDPGEGLRIAAGLGLRYYSPVGPLRLDIGVPLNPRAVDDPFQFYLAIGQAF